MTKEVIVESFELDHTAVKAPYVRLIGEETGPKGDVISNYDIRLVQPNEDSIPTAGLHTIEHLLAMLIRKRIDGMIDCSKSSGSSISHSTFASQPALSMNLGFIFLMT